MKVFDQYKLLSENFFSFITVHFFNFIKKYFNFIQIYITFTKRKV